MTYPNTDVPGPPSGVSNKEARKDNLFTAALVSFVVLAIIIVYNVLGGDQDDSPVSVSTPSPTVSETPDPAPTEIEDDEPTEEPTEESEAPAPSPSTTRTSETPSPSSSPTWANNAPEPEATETAEPDGGTATVSRVIDGDTVELANGDRVRVLGIDTPERGECHADTATQRMAALVQGQRVTLVQDGDDRDHYDRLLRYIDVNGVDAGLTLIQEGLAQSRYDSRDGYGFHTREPQYIAADEATAQQTCVAQPPPPQEAQPEPEPAPQPPANDCDPNYTPCVPVYPPDINCGDISFPVRVIGSDPHGFDADGDGQGCDAND